MKRIKQCCSYPGCPGAPNSPHKICDNCLQVRYCSEECQNAHWNAGHKQSCKGRTCEVVLCKHNRNPAPRWQGVSASIAEVKEWLQNPNNLKCPTLHSTEFHNQPSNKLANHFSIAPSSGHCLGFTHGNYHAVRLDKQSLTEKQFSILVDVMDVLVKWYDNGPGTVTSGKLDFASAEVRHKLWELAKQEQAANAALTPGKISLVRINARQPAPSSWEVQEATREEVATLLNSPHRIDCPYPTRLGLPLCILPVGDQPLHTAPMPVLRHRTGYFDPPEGLNQPATFLTLSPKTAQAPRFILDDVLVLRTDAEPLTMEQLLKADVMMGELLRQFDEEVSAANMAIKEGERGVVRPTFSTMLDAAWGQGSWEKLEQAQGSSWDFLYGQDDADDDDAGDEDDDEGDETFRRMGLTFLLHRPGAD